MFFDAHRHKNIYFMNEVLRDNIAPIIRSAHSNEVLHNKVLPAI
jgi:hypothetical protein